MICTITVFIARRYHFAGEIIIWMCVCFWVFFSPISLLHATKKLDNFFTIVCRTESLQETEFWFLALSHSNKQNFCLSHWVTATNKITICYQKVPKNNKNVLKKWQKVPTSAKKRSNVPKNLALLTFWQLFWQHIKILFVTVTQCDKQFFCLLQWFSATN